MGGTSLVPIMGRAAGVHEVCRQMLVPSLWRFVGDVFLLCAAVTLHFLLFFRDWYYSCPQNLLPGKAYGGLWQGIIPFFNCLLGVDCILSSFVCFQKQQSSV